MIDQLLGRIFFNQWMVFVITLVLFLVMAEVGYRSGRIYRKKHPAVKESDSGGGHGAVLGLLGLLLGFTFAMAVGRYDTRLKLAIDEANSIGTTWLRSDFLPGALRFEAKDLLRKYTELKAKSATTPDNTPEMGEMRAEIGKVQMGLWTLTGKAAELAPTPVTTSFITTLNETIDFDSSNLMATRNHVPGVVWLLLMIVAASGCWVSGFGSGFSGVRSAFGQIVFPVLIGVVITLIADIDRPEMGLIGVSQTPMNNLLESMRP